VWQVNVERFRCRVSGVSSYVIGSTTPLWIDLVNSSMPLVSMFHVASFTNWELFEKLIWHWLYIRYRLILLGCPLVHIRSLSPKPLCVRLNGDGSSPPLPPRGSTHSVRVHWDRCARFMFPSQPSKKATDTSPIIRLWYHLESPSVTRWLSVARRWYSDAPSAKHSSSYLGTPLNWSTG